MEGCLLAEMTALLQADGVAFVLACLHRCFGRDLNCIAQLRFYASAHCKCLIFFHALDKVGLTHVTCASQIVQTPSNENHQCMACVFDILFTAMLSFAVLRCVSVSLHVLSHV